VFEIEVEVMLAGKT